MGIGTNAFVTGANRGIGLGLVKELIKVSSIKNVFASCRNPDNAMELQELAKSNCAVKILKLDVTKDDSIKSAVELVESKVGNAGIHLLINNSGILTPHGGVSHLDVNRAAFLEHFNVNSVAPIIVFSNFLPLLNKARDYNGSPPIVLNVSSGLGSISNCTGVKSMFFDNCVYGASKAALNYFTKSIASDEPAIIVVAMCPGWVRTDMGSSKAELSVEESTEAIIKVLSNLEKKDSGKFLNKSGSLSY